MNILIANDDGINARGINELAKALSSIADIYISAPDSQRSASGHGITMHSEITATKRDFEYAKAAYSISGTPADCVKLGLDLYRRDGIEIDMVFSGINLGSNLGSDVLYSGTVSAAMEGRIKGRPAVAVSVHGNDPQHFEYACALAVLAAKMVYENREEKLVLSINVPDLPASDIKGVKSAHLGIKLYDETYTLVKETENSRVFKYHGDPIELEENSDITDVSLIDGGYATITPLRLDLADYDAFSEIDMWCAEVGNVLIY